MKKIVIGILILVLVGLFFTLKEHVRSGLGAVNGIATEDDVFDSRDSARIQAYCKKAIRYWQEQKNMAYTAYRTSGDPSLYGQAREAGTQLGIIANKCAVW